MDEQILLQHALKFLVECEYDCRNVLFETLAEKLSIPHTQLEQLLRDLRAANLIEPDSFVLTVEGREYALHVLQAHRLYETYLARKTGVPESSWHILADAKEHELSESDVQKLSEELGNPRFDPHGDPIPNAMGQMPARQGRLLTDYPVGWAGRVVHIEDEPPRLYAFIAKAGIAPDTLLRIEHKDSRQIKIYTEGRTFNFPLETAEQITAVELTDGEIFDDSIERLSGLQPGQEADILGLSPLCRGLERNRLLDLGFVPGTRISIELVNPSGNPIGYGIRGACIALRLDQAERIRIRKVNQ